MAVAALVQVAIVAELGSLSSTYRNTRWAVRGIGCELITNIAGRGGCSWSRAFRGRRAPDDGNGALAIVTGATGGIGAEIAAGLAATGYHVIVAARDPKRGNDVVARLRAAGGKAEYVPLHAHLPESAAALAATVGRRPCAILVNNAGVMSVGKGEILRTNYIGPAVLTVALLPALRRHPTPRVVNVGSSSHLRAACINPALLTSTERDRDLGAYAQSKLALMQFSSLLRASLPWLTVVDAHPGLVWTPMLQRHWGPLAPALERSGVSRILFKTPDRGAATILVAATSQRDPPATWGERSRWRRGWRTQPYFVNQRPGGFASAESRDLDAARAAWKVMVEPTARRIAPEAIPEGFRPMTSSGAE